MSTQENLSKLVMGIENKRVVREQAKSGLVALRSKPATQSLPGLVARITALEGIIAKLVD